MKPAQRLQKAASAFARGDLALAEAECRDIVASSPQDADAIHLLGLIRRRAGDLGEAEELLRRSVAIDPQRAEVRVNLGNLLRAKGALRDAESEYRWALQLEPGSRTARLALARVLNDGQAWAAAGQEAGQLLQADERDAEAWVALGVSRRAQGQLSEAESAYRRALALRPDYAVAQHNLGALLGQLNRAEESLDSLDRAAALGVKSRELHFNRGRALIELGQFDAAEAALHAAVHLAPGDAEAQVLLAKLRFMRGDPAFARDLVLASGAQPRLRATLADILRRAGQLEESAAILHAMIETDGWSASTAAGLAVNLQEQGRLAEAVAHARAAFSAQPGDSDMAETLITLLLQLGEASEARSLIARQRQLHPLDQRWLAHEATAARLLGDPRYEVLFDYGHFVRPYDLEPPAGYASVEDFNADLIGRLGELHGQGFRTHPLDQSLRGGTQTSRSLLADPDPRIRAFLEALKAPLAAYQEAIGHDATHPLLERNVGPARMVGCWSVRLQRNGFHVNHVHPEGWISSAYYVDVPDEVRDPDAKSGWIKFGEPRFATPGAEPAHFIQPRAGRLVLFPSYMWHGTTALMGDQPRMTIAFDAVADRPSA